MTNSHHTQSPPLMMMMMTLMTLRRTTTDDHESSAQRIWCPNFHSRARDCIIFVFFPLPLVCLYAPCSDRRWWDLKKRCTHLHDRFCFVNFCVCFAVEMLDFAFYGDLIAFYWNEIECHWNWGFKQRESEIQLWYFVCDASEISVCWWQSSTHRCARVGVRALPLRAAQFRNCANPIANKSSIPFSRHFWLTTCSPCLHFPVRSSFRYSCGILRWITLFLNKISKERKKIQFFPAVKRKSHSRYTSCNGVCACWFRHTCLRVPCSNAKEDALPEVPLLVKCDWNSLTPKNYYQSW